MRKRLPRTFLDQVAGLRKLCRKMVGLLFESLLVDNLLVDMLLGNLVEDNLVEEFLPAEGTVLENLVEVDLFTK